MRELIEYVDRERERLAGLVRTLVRIPSENIPPHGAEHAAQEYVASFLEALGWRVDVYEPDATPGVREHPLYWDGRDYAGRPNVTAVRKGAGGGRSLLLTGHIDTVPVGSAPWTRRPFGGEIEGERLYGRGSMDMKAGIAIALFLAEALDRLGIVLDGDLLVESVVDEEFGGVNGTLAGRVRGYLADAAILTEATGLRICPAQRGGRTVHITFTAPGDIFADVQGGVIAQLRCFLNGVERFQEMRNRTLPGHEYYDHLKEPAPVSVTRVYTAPWTFAEPIAVPLTCKVEMYWQAGPGESQENIDRQFHEWLDAMVAANPAIFPVKPSVEFPIRWLPASVVPRSEAMLGELACAAQEALGVDPVVQGLEAPCDMYAIHAFGIPAVLWGPRGGGAHGPDEYVELGSVVDAARVLAAFLGRWCGGRVV